MKILYHHRTASKDGQAVHIEEMIEALRGLGHEVLVVAPEQGSSEGRMGGSVGWVHRMKAVLPKAVYELMELSYSLVAYRKLMKAAHAFKPDAIYERYNLFFLAGVMARKRLRVPLLLEVNSPLVLERIEHSGGLYLQRLARWAEATAWRNADVVLPVTAVLAQHVEAYGVPSHRIHVVPNGINRQHFANAPTTDEAKNRLGLQGRLVLGFTGFLRDWHRVDRIIDWMAAPTTPAHVHLLVVGDGPVRSDLQSQAHRLGLAGRVTFTGVIHRDAVPAHVAAFDIALQPAVTAYASPLKLMEYLALGKAVVAPSTPNLLEVLTHEVNALMFDENRLGALEETLTRLCSDAALRERLGAGSSQTIDRLGLTWARNAQRVVQLIQANA